jgi:hypothetical protein
MLESRNPVVDGFVRIFIIIFEHDSMPLTCQKDNICNTMAQSMAATLSNCYLPLKVLSDSHKRLEQCQAHLISMHSNGNGT